MKKTDTFDSSCSLTFSIFTSVVFCCTLTVFLKNRNKIILHETFISHIIPSVSPSPAAVATLVAHHRQCVSVMSINNSLMLMSSDFLKGGHKIPAMFIVGVVFFNFKHNQCITSQFEDFIANYISVKYTQQILSSLSIK